MFVNSSFKVCVKVFTDLRLAGNLLFRMSNVVTERSFFYAILATKTLALLVPLCVHDFMFFDVARSVSSFLINLKLVYSNLLVSLGCLVE